MMASMKYFILSFLCLISSSVPTAEATISNDVNDLKFFYIPSPAEKIEIAFNNANSLDASNLRAGVKTVVIIDGFLSDSSSPLSIQLSTVYSSRGDANVIVVDWGKLSGSGSTIGNPFEVLGAYLTVIGNVGPVGGHIADFLNFLKENKQIEFSDVTIIGQSMGAHISGIAGVKVRDYYNSLLGRIVGLDPAGPLFSTELRRNKRLFKGQASFVDIYHSNRGTLGDTKHDTGDVNVYLNGGKNQPGCEEADVSGFAGFCSHSYAGQFFAALSDSSVTVTACPCKVLLGIRICTCTTCQFECSNGINVGPHIDTSARGPYHVTYGPLAP